MVERARLTRLGRLEWCGAHAAPKAVWLLWVTAGPAELMVLVMEDQNEAWKRQTEARLWYLEDAVKPQRIRRAVNGKPLPPPAYEPGERFPLTKWLMVRLDALEVLLRVLLDADAARSEDQLDCSTLEDLMRPTLEELEAWSERQMEPPIEIREAMAAVLFARVVMLEDPTWPLHREGTE